MPPRCRFPDEIPVWWDEYDATFFQLVPFVDDSGDVQSYDVDCEGNPFVWFDATPAECLVAESTCVPLTRAAREECECIRAQMEDDKEGNRQ